MPAKTVAALFVHKTAMDHPSLPESVARHDKLTPTELRVLRDIVDMGDAPEVADALRIADNTVKAHLRRVYQKTGKRRQPSLVKLAAGFSTRSSASLTRWPPQITRTTRALTARCNFQGAIAKTV